MSNGKFFSGLPDSMLRGSSNRPDRMESHLFWPDESKTESVNNSNRTTPSKRAAKPVPAEEVQQYKEFMDQNQADTPTAKELFSQHQTSKIQFNDYADGGGNNSSARISNQNKRSSVTPVKNVNMDNNNQNIHSNRNNGDHYAKLNALKSNIGFYDYPDESCSAKVTARTNKKNNETSIAFDEPPKDYQKSNRRDQRNNASSIGNNRSDDNVLKTCKMNNDLYDLDKKVTNLSMNTNNYNNSNEFSVNKSARFIEETSNGGDNYDIPIKVRNETTHSSHTATTYATTQQRDHQNSQQYQNTHNVPISLDRDYVPGRSSRGCPQKSYNNITPLYSQQEQSPVIQAKSRAHDHLKSNIFFQNTSNNTSPPTTSRQHRPTSVRDSAVCRVGVGLPDM